MPTFLYHILLMLTICNEVAVADTCRNSQCNSDCASEGTYPWTGAVAKPGVCYFCWSTGFLGACPDGTTHRTGQLGYEDCCNEYQCHSCGEAPDPCPCCYQAEPSLPGTGAQAGNGKCFYCYDTGIGGDCEPGTDHRNDGWAIVGYDTCCDERSTVAQQCSRTDLSSYCTTENLGFDNNGILDDIGDGINDAIDGIGDGINDAIDGIGDVFSGFELFGPKYHLDGCTAVCTLGIRDVLELRLEIDVEGTNDGSFEVWYVCPLSPATGRLCSLARHRIPTYDPSYLRSPSYHRPASGSGVLK